MTDAELKNLRRTQMAEKKTESKQIIYFDTGHTLLNLVTGSGEKAGFDMSKQAIATTIAIVEAFQKIKNLSRVIKQLPEAKTKQEQQSLMQKSGEIIAEILDDALESDESETTIELNLAVLKFKHTIKKKKS